MVFVGLRLHPELRRHRRARRGQPAPPRSPWTPTGRPGPTAGAAARSQQHAGHRPPVSVLGLRDGRVRAEPLPDPLGGGILLLMLAGNLLPPQILLIPVAKFSELTGLYDTLCALIAVQVGFGLGFYTFVLHGFMRDLPGEIHEAATIDGAGDGADLHQGDAAADPARAGRSRGALVHLDLQRPALGDHRAAHRRQHAGHPGAARPPGASSRPGTSSPPVRSSRPSPPSRSSCASSGTSSPAWRWERSSELGPAHRDWAVRGGPRPGGRRPGAAGLDRRRHPGLGPEQAARLRDSAGPPTVGGGGATASRQVRGADLIVDHGNGLLGARLVWPEDAVELVTDGPLTWLTARGHDTTGDLELLLEIHTCADHDVVSKQADADQRRPPHPYASRVPSARHGSCRSAPARSCISSAGDWAREFTPHRIVLASRRPVHRQPPRHHRPTTTPRRLSLRLTSRAGRPGVRDRARLERLLAAPDRRLPLPGSGPSGRRHRRRVDRPSTRARRDLHDPGHPWRLRARRTQRSPASLAQLPAQLARP